MILIDRILVGGIGWVLRRVAAAAAGEAADESHLREDLLAAEMRLELGEIDEAEFAAIERELLARIREVRGETAAAGGRYSVESIDADVGDG